MRKSDRISEDDRGAVAIEYGLIVALLFVAILSAAQAVSDANNDSFNNVESEIVKAHNG
ncbi:MAG: Flp family type IVb pilin [Pseudomonadota bacterium]